MKIISGKVILALLFGFLGLAVQCRGERGVFLGTIKNESDSGFYFVTTSTPLSQLEELIKNYKGSFLESVVRPFAYSGKPVPSVPASQTQTQYKQAWESLLHPTSGGGGGPVVKAQGKIYSTTSVPFCLDRNTEINYLRDDFLSIDYEDNKSPEDPSSYKDPSEYTDYLNNQTIIMVPANENSCQPWILIGREGGTHEDTYKVQTYLTTKDGTVKEGGSKVPCCVKAGKPCATDTPFGDPLTKQVGTAVMAKKQQGIISLTISKDKDLANLGVVTAFDVTAGWSRPAWLGPMTGTYSQWFGFQTRLPGYKAPALTKGCKLGFDCNEWRSIIAEQYKRLWQYATMLVRGKKAERERMEQQRGLQEGWREMGIEVSLPRMYSPGWNVFTEKNIKKLLKNPYKGSAEGNVICEYK